MKIKKQAKNYLKGLSALLLCGAGVANAGTGFIILGDGGTGLQGQYLVSNAIEQVCTDQQACNFAVGLGDNIYEKGPNSSTDQQFQDKFETPYQTLSFPFFMAMGNHDTTLLFAGDGGYNYRGNYEVAYTENSDKWNMPARYYGGETEDALFVVYDSNPMGAYLPESGYWAPRGQFVQEQKAWVQQTMDASDKTWKFAFAHHLYVSNGLSAYDIKPQGQGPNKEFIEEALCDRADFVFNGHEHAQQIINPKTGDCGVKTSFVITGTGAKSNSTKRWFTWHSRQWESFGKLGFMHGYVDGANFTLTTYVVEEDGSFTQAFQKTYTK